MVNEKKANGSGVLYLFLAVIISAAGVILPEFMIITGIFSMAFTIAASLLLPLSVAFLPPVLTALLSLFLGQNYYMAALFAGLVLPGALSIAHCIKRKCHMVPTFITGLIVTSVWMLADLGAYIYIRGGELSVNGMKIAFRPFTDEYTAMYNTIVSTYKELNPALGNQMESVFSDFTKLMGTALTMAAPSIIISTLAVMVFLAILIAKRMLYKKGIDVSSLKLFRNFTFPKSAAILYIICLLGQIFAGGFVGTAFFNLYSVLSTLFLLSGLSFLAFWMNKSGMSKAAKRILFIFIILICSLPFSFSMVISGAGVLDSLSDFRTRLSKKKGE